MKLEAIFKTTFHLIDTGNWTGSCQELERDVLFKFPSNFSCNLRLIVSVPHYEIKFNSMPHGK